MTETRILKKSIPKLKQEPESLNKIQRQTTFEEVIKGFTFETAKLEAERCLQCKKPKSCEYP